MNGELLCLPSTIPLCIFINPDWNHRRHCPRQPPLATQISRRRRPKDRWKSRNRRPPSRPWKPTSVPVCPLLFFSSFFSSLIYSSKEIDGGLGLARVGAWKKGFSSFSWCESDLPHRGILTSSCTCFSTFLVVRAETKRLNDEAEEMLKAKSNIGSEITEKQRKLSLLEAESCTLSQVINLLQNLDTNVIIQSSIHTS